MSIEGPNCMVFHFLMSQIRTMFSTGHQFGLTTQDLFIHPGDLSQCRGEY